MVPVSHRKSGASRSRRCCSGDRESPRWIGKLTARLRYPARTAALPDPDPRPFGTEASRLPPTSLWIAQEHVAAKKKLQGNVLDGDAYLLLRGRRHVAKREQQNAPQGNTDHGIQCRRGPGHKRRGDDQVPPSHTKIIPLGVFKDMMRAGCHQHPQLNGSRSVAAE